MALTPLTTALAAAGLTLTLGGGVLLAGPALAGAPPTSAAGQVTAASGTALTVADTPATGTRGTHPGAAAGTRGLKGTCARIPTELTRTATRTTRLNGSATTKGSLAWLQARIDKAQAAGRTTLAARLRTRLAEETALLSVLPERTTWLTDLQGKVCSLLPSATGSTGSTDPTGSATPSAGTATS